jgi:hypothetical protein
MEPEVIHVPELAHLMGRSEAAIRSAVQHKAEWLPPFYRQGARLCWRLETVRYFLRQYEAGECRPKKAGRPRKEAPRIA